MVVQQEVLKKIKKKEKLVGDGNVLALAAHNWIAVIIHWDSDAFQGLKID